MEARKKDEIYDAKAWQGLKDFVRAPLLAVNNDQRSLAQLHRQNLQMVHGFLKKLIELLRRPTGCNSEHLPQHRETFEEAYLKYFGPVQMNQESKEIETIFMSMYDKFSLVRDFVSEENSCERINEHWNEVYNYQAYMNYLCCLIELKNHQ